MTNYNYLNDHIRKTILEGFLEDHPDMEPNEVIKETINGRFLLNAINEIIERIGQSVAVSDLEKRGELAITTDERYQHCQVCLRASKYVIGHLFQHRYEHFDLSSKKEYEGLIRNLEKEARKTSGELSKIRKTFVGWLEGERPSRLEIKEQLVQYCYNFVDLLELHYLILNQQTELIGIYNAYIDKVIEVYFDKKKTSPPASSFKSIIHICKLINNTETVEVGNQYNREALDKTIGICESRIRDLQNRQHDLAQVIQYLLPITPDREKNVDLEKQGKAKEDSTDDRSFLSRLFS